MKAASLLLGLLSLVQLAAAGGVLAIDYGTEWMKVSLVKPGVPFDVLLNTLVCPISCTKVSFATPLIGLPAACRESVKSRDSKRKIQSIVALKGQDRWIGGDAATLVRTTFYEVHIVTDAPCLCFWCSKRVQASRFPDSVYPSVKLLLGHSDNDIQAKTYQNIYRKSLDVNATSGRILYRDATSTSNEGLQFPEEALAMQFAHAKKLAKEAANGDSVTDVVVTVKLYTCIAPQPFLTI
jgi:hypoxia up-regulated 1